MDEVGNLQGARQQKEAWETATEAALVAGGMLMEEARERARALAAGSWKTCTPEEAAMSEFRARSWSVATPEDVALPVGRVAFSVLDVGLE